jgi:quercetin dioxygenase-like cupin family protein
MSGPRHLASLLTYQPQGVVSRALVKRSSGTVTLFAFDRGESLSEHTAPFDALLYVIEGAAEVVVGGKVHRVESGEAIDLPARVPHAVRAIEAFKMLLVMIRDGVSASASSTPDASATPGGR